MKGFLFLSRKKKEKRKGVLYIFVWFAVLTSLLPQKFLLCSLITRPSYGFRRGSYLTRVLRLAFYPKLCDECRALCFPSSLARGLNSYALFLSVHAHVTCLHVHVHKCLEICVCLLVPLTVSRYVLMRAQMFSRLVLQG